jgi:hypothetical protein
MDPMDLYEVGRQVVQRHLNHLDDEREEKTLYKRIDRHGNFYGRPFIKNGAVYRSLRFSRIRMKRLLQPHKKGEPRKYWLALRNIFYSRFHEEEDTNVSTTAFLCFLEKNEDKILPSSFKNLATTRTVLRLLFQDPLFMAALREQQEQEAQEAQEALALTDDEHQQNASMLCFILPLLPSFLTVFFLLYCSSPLATELNECSFMYYNNSTTIA